MGLDSSSGYISDGAMSSSSPPHCPVHCPCKSCKRGYPWPRLRTTGSDSGQWTESVLEVTWRNHWQPGCFYSPQALGLMPPCKEQSKATEPLACLVSTVRASRRVLRCPQTGTSAPCVRTSLHSWHGAKFSLGLGAAQNEVAPIGLDSESS